MAEKMYHSKKSDLLKKIRRIQGAVVELMKSDGGAIIFDLSLVINVVLCYVMYSLSKVDS